MHVLCMHVRQMVSMHVPCAYSCMYLHAFMHVTWLGGVLVGHRQPHLQYIPLHLQLRCALLQALVEFKPKAQLRARPPDHPISVNVLDVEPKPQMHGVRAEIDLTFPVLKHREGLYKVPR